MSADVCACMKREDPTRVPSARLQICATCHQPWRSSGEVGCADHSVHGTLTDASFRTASASHGHLVSSSCDCPPSFIAPLCSGACTPLMHATLRRGGLAPGQGIPLPLRQTWQARRSTRHVRTEWAAAGPSSGTPVGDARQAKVNARSLHESTLANRSAAGSTSSHHQHKHCHICKD